MIGKILKGTTGKPCTCPDGKKCTGCKKLHVKPTVYVEEPHRLNIPIVVSHYRAKPRRWSFRKDEPAKKPVVRTTLCQWYKRRKAHCALKRITKRERQERIAQATRERELDYIEHLRLQQEYAPIIVKEKTEKVKEKKPKKTENVPVVKEKKPKRVKTRTATAKPHADSKFVTVKQYNRYDKLSERFVAFCYKACCQFYCYLSFIFIIGFVLIYFL